MKIFFDRFGIKIFRHHLGKYMRRWIVSTPIGMVRLHNIKRADQDPYLHTHPFGFVSFVLKGGYVEQTPIVGSHPSQGLTKLQTVRWMSVSPLDKAHRIDQIFDDTWTLVFTTTRLQDWGFWVDGEFVPWREFETIKMTPEEFQEYKDAWPR